MEVSTNFALLLTAGALVLVFGALLLLYRRLNGAFRRDAAGPAELAVAREEPKGQRRFFEQLFLQSSTAAQIFDRDGNRVRTNGEWHRLFDVPEGALSGRPYNIFEDPAIKRAGLDSELRRVLRDGIAAEWEMLLDLADGRHGMRWFRLKAFPLWAREGTITNLVLHYEDISARKGAEQRMRASLKEKEVLLKEVHHRVKNNMQLMKSMLHLQAGYLTDPEALSMFNDSASRIHTMALVHEKLYQSESFGTVDICAYLTYIADNLKQTYARPDLALSIRADLAPAVLDLDTAIPCGLLANELISNAIKHAFTGRRHGAVSLGLRLLSAHAPADNGGVRRFELSVSDDGRGIPHGLEASRTSSLGLKLVQSLVYQLGGKIDVESAPAGGTTFRVRFSVPKETHSPFGGVGEMSS